MDERSADKTPEEIADELLAEAGWPKLNGGGEAEATTQIVELAKLSKLDYARCRTDKAKKLGISAAALDALVKEARSSTRKKFFTRTGTSSHGRKWSTVQICSSPFMTGSGSM